MRDDTFFLLVPINNPNRLSDIIQALPTEQRGGVEVKGFTKKGEQKTGFLFSVGKWNLVRMIIDKLRDPSVGVNFELYCIIFDIPYRILSQSERKGIMIKRIEGLVEDIKRGDATTEKLLLDHEYMTKRGEISF